MRSAIYSNRPGIFAALIRAKEGGSSSHCAIQIDGKVVDSTLKFGVREWTREEWLKQGHKIQAEYPMSLPDAEAADAWLTRVQASRPRYDWLRILGYILWRSMGKRSAYTCEELLLGYMIAGGVTLSDKPRRPGVRLLREVTYQRANDQARA